MTEVTGKHYLTLTVEADEVYHIKPSVIRIADIYNLTEGELMIATQNDFTVTDGVGEFITLGAGAAANLQTVPKDGIYIKAAVDGKVSIKGAA